MKVPAIGDRIGRYRILGPIGHGSTGQVFRAWDEVLAREVALKMLWPQLASEERIRERFSREARAAAGLDSPFIVRVYDIGEADGMPYLAMEHLTGGSLVTDVALRPLDWRRACEVTRDIARALALAHSRGIVHRDVKPSNVILDVDGHAKLADFGLARAVADESATVTSIGDLAGTPAFVAPELIEGGKATPESDIYSLGVFLYQLATGRLPFEGDSPAALLQAHLSGFASRPSSHDPGLPRDLDTIALGCLARRPGERYPSAGLVAEDLESVLQGRAVIGSPAGARLTGPIPAWMKWVPWSERTLVSINEDLREVQARETEMRRHAEDAQVLLRRCEELASRSEKDAAGWRVVAGQNLESGDENSAREALGYAQEHDQNARHYREEAEKQRIAVEDACTAATLAASDAEAADVRAHVLIARRNRARAALGIDGPRCGKWVRILGVVVVAVALVYAFPRAPVADEKIEPEVRPALENRAPLPTVHVEEIPTDTMDIPGRFLNVTSRRLAVTLNVDALAVGDLDGDGDQDILLYRPQKRSSALLLRNDARGNFADPESIPELGWPQILTLGDVDGDGDLDALTGGGAYAGSIRHRLLLNDGSARFQDVSAVNLPDLKIRTANHFLLADFDDDGDQDIYISCGFAGSPFQVPPSRSDPEQDRLLINDGRGHFRDGTSSTLSEDTAISTGAATGDIDRDGDLDIIVNRRDGPPKVLVNDGRGHFAAAPNAISPAVTWNVALCPLLVDVDLDGDLDLFLATNSPNGSGSGERDRLLLNDGAGNFSDVTESWLPPFTTHINGFCAVADVNKDGFPDILVPWPETLLTLHDRTEIPGIVLAGGRGSLSSIGQRTFGARTYVMQPDAPPGSGISNWRPLFPYSFTTIDLEGDGDSDLVMIAANARFLSIWENRQ